MNVTTPVTGSIWNKSASAPPSMLNVTASPFGSTPFASPTNVVFSGTVTISPSSTFVKNGASFGAASTTSVTRTVTFRSWKSVPSLILSTISKSLSPFASAGASKSGATLNVTTPVTGSMMNRSASAPPSMLKVTASPSGSDPSASPTKIVFSGTVTI